MPIDVRTITDDEVEEFHRVESYGFGYIPHSGESLEVERKVMEVDRCLSCFDDGAMVSTAAAYSFRMTVPGGRDIPVGAVTAVTVAQTHRRQGLLRRMMEHQLDDCASRGEPAAVLNASEAAIYGRFGYGLASLYATVSLQTLRADFAAPVDTSLRLRLVPQDDAVPALLPIYDAWRQTRPGAMTQTEAWFSCVLGRTPVWKGGGNVFVVVCDPDPGGAHDGGFALYTMDNDHLPGHWKLTVRELIAADPAVRARLWRYLLDVDLVGTVTAEAVPVDDVLRWLLLDPRQVRTTSVRDFLFVRVLDVEAALSARTYSSADELTFEVDDPFRPHTSGRYVVKGDGSSASCGRSDATGEADLALNIRELGSLYLGGVRASDLAAAGRLSAASPEALERADAFFTSPVAPFCITRF